MSGEGKAVEVEEGLGMEKKASVGFWCVVWFAAWGDCCVGLVGWLGRDGMGVRGGKGGKCVGGKERERESEGD